MFIGLNKTLTILVNISLLSNNIKPYIISKIELKIKKKTNEQNRYTFDRC